MIAIGLDPSMAAFGYSVILRHDVLSAGVWRTEPSKRAGAKDDQGERFGFLATSLAELVRVDRTAFADAELVLFVEATTLQAQKSRWNASMLGRARGIVDGVAAAHGLEVFEVDADQRKRVVPFATRADKVSKAQIRTAVLELYPAALTYLPDTALGHGASDAVALAHVGSELWRFRRQLKSARSGP